MPARGPERTVQEEAVPIWVVPSECSPNPPPRDLRHKLVHPVAINPASPGGREMPRRPEQGGRKADSSIGPRLSSHTMHELWAVRGSRRRLRGSATPFRRCRMTWAWRPAVSPRCLPGRRASSRSADVGGACSRLSDPHVGFRGLVRLGAQKQAGEVRPIRGSGPAPSGPWRPEERRRPSFPPSASSSLETAVRAPLPVPG